MSEVFYNLRIQFQGTYYQGWQIQPNVSTVQGELNKALIKIFKSDTIHSTGCGRTDAGVHALNYLVKVKTPFFIEFNSLVLALNANLPKDIRVLSATESFKDFLPTNHAISKEYLYRFSNFNNPNAFQETFIPNVSYELDFELMQRAVKSFIGEHDFSDFQCTGSQVKTSIRKILECELIKVEQHCLDGMFPEHYAFKVVGNGFLKQMVRLMVGSIWSVGRHKLTIAELENALRSPTGKKIGIVAPASGLTKINVTY